MSTWRTVKGWNTLCELGDFKSLFQMHHLSIYAAPEWGATSLTSDSARLELTKHAAGGAGVPVGGLIVPYGIFFSSSALIPERAKGAPAHMPTPKSCECKGEPVVSVSHSCLIWMDEFRGPGAAQGNKKLSPGLVVLPVWQIRLHQETSKHSPIQPTGWHGALDHSDGPFTRLPQEGGERLHISILSWHSSYLLWCSGTCDHWLLTGFPQVLCIKTSLERLGRTSVVLWFPSCIHSS